MPISRRDVIFAGATATLTLAMVGAGRALNKFSDAADIEALRKGISQAIGEDALTPNTPDKYIWQNGVEDFENMSLIHQKFIFAAQEALTKVLDSKVREELKATRSGLYHAAIEFSAKNEKTKAAFAEFVLIMERKGYIINPETTALKLYDTDVPLLTRKNSSGPFTSTYDRPPTNIALEIQVNLPIPDNDAKRVVRVKLAQATPEFK